MRGHGATRCMRTSEAPQIPPSRACRRFCTAESRSATYVALIWYVYVFLSIRAASAAIVVTQLPTRPSWHLAGKRFRFPLIRLKRISRFAAVDLWLKNGAFFAAEKRPGVATLANGSHAFLHGDMGTGRVRELLVRGR